MKLPCAVVRDLLPLYAEKMTEPETQKLVDEHLKECPECRKKLAETETGTPAPVDTTKPLRALKKQIRRRRLYAALIAGLFVLVCFVTYDYHTGSLKPLSWEEGLVEAKGVVPVTSEDQYRKAVHIRKGNEEEPEPAEEGLSFSMSSRIAGVETEIVEDDDGTVTAIIQGFGRWSASGQGNADMSGELTLCPVPDRVIYGYGEPQTILWGSPMSGGIEVLPRLALSYYVMIAAAFAVITGFLWFLFRKKQGSWILRQVFFAPVCYVTAHLLLMGFRATSFSIIRDLCYILLLSAALYALVSLLWQVWLQRRKEA